MADEKDEKASKKDKKAKKGKGEEPGGVTVSLAAHPRAKAGIRRARTRAAFLSFMGVLILNLMGHQDPFDAVWRALLAGIIVNVIVWRCAIIVWRHIVLNELRQAEELRAARIREQHEQLAARAADQANSPGFRVA